jgi:hypothetical protein
VAAAVVVAMGHTHCREATAAFDNSVAGAAAAVAADTSREIMQRWRSITFEITI